MVLDAQRQHSGNAPVPSWHASHGRHELKGSMLITIG